MQITVTGHQMEITDPLRQYCSDKIGRIQKHFDHLTTTHIVLQVQKARHVAEATIHARGATLHANADGEDMYAAIDQLADRLDRQVLRHKEKQTSHHRAEGSERKHTNDNGE